MYEVGGSESDPLVLRPEGTACVMRAHLASTSASASLQRYWYTGPMFRHERPQAGRYRQFHQAGWLHPKTCRELHRENHRPCAGVEAIGIDSMEVDIEAVWLCWKVVQRILQRGGLQDEANALRMRVNNLGTDQERSAYSRKLREYFLQQHKLSPVSAARLANGGSALGILDSKHPDDVAASATAPPIADFWGGQTRERFEATCTALKELCVPISVDPSLARGLDYYNGLCWELQVDAGGEGSASSSTRALTLAGGGRYDRLAQLMGAKAPVPAVGKW